MRSYLEPEMNITAFDVENVLTESGAPTSIDDAEKSSYIEKTSYEDLLNW